MGNKKGSDVASAERRVVAVRLRAAGLSFRRIAERLGITHTQARRDILAGLSALHKELVQQTKELVALEKERLEMPLARLAKIIQDKNADVRDKCLAIETWRKLSESRRKLLGLDQPDKQQILGDADAPIQIISVTKPVDAPAS